MRTVSFIFLIIFLSFEFTLFSQRSNNQFKTNDKGVMFGYVGYNRSVYSKSSIHFASTNYDFSLNNVSLSDNPESISAGKYFDPIGVEYFQFNAHIGFYIFNKWALTLGVDKLNMFMDDGQHVNISGTFAPNAHNDFEGEYNNEIITPTREQIYYRQHEGVNYIRIGVQRTDQLYKSRKNEFAFNTNIGLGLGPIFSNSDYTFDNFTRQQASGVSGYGISAHAGLRFDFFKHIFFQTTLSGGMLNQRNIALSSNSPEEAKHLTGYFSPEIAIGFSFLVKESDCGTCPGW